MAGRVNARVPPRDRTLSTGASKRVQTLKNATEMWRHRSGLHVLLHSCRPMQLAGHSTINLGLNLHDEIGLSNAPDIHCAHPLNTPCTCIQIQSVAYNRIIEI